MIRVAPCMLILLMGCAAIPHTDIPIEPPELVRMAPLPPAVSAVSPLGLKMQVLLHVLENGTVGEAKVLESNALPEWDSLAVQSIKRWQFRAARRNGVPVDIWIRQPVVIRLQEPIIRILGELVSATRLEADSLYSMIQNGAEFDTLAAHVREASAGEHGGFLGAVDIAIYPPHVRDELQKLREDETTRPLRVGDEYVIFRRFRRDVPKHPPG